MVYNMDINFFYLYRYSNNKIRIYFCGDEIFTNILPKNFI